MGVEAGGERKEKRGLGKDDSLSCICKYFTERESKSEREQ